MASSANLCQPCNDTPVDATWALLSFSNQHADCLTVCLSVQASKNLQITEGSSKVSGALYMAGKEHLNLLLDAYGTFSHTNPLHTDVWPSMRQLESDVIAMTASMLGGVSAAARTALHNIAAIHDPSK